MSTEFTLYNTAITSTNLGDYIIMDSVKRELDFLLSKFFMHELTTHDSIGVEGLKRIYKSKFCIVGGTNLLASNMLRKRQWKISPKDLTILTNAILLGVGWYQYESKPSIGTKLLLKRILSKDYIHSVRDSYTEEKLKSIGINNVLNTGCATLWKLNKEHCEKIPSSKSTNVVITFTDYRKAAKEDNKLLELLRKIYHNIYIWPQGRYDEHYIKNNIQLKDEIILPFSLSSYDNLLKTNKDIDYIGTRLHGGIRALQHGRRCIIIGVDNRAEEKAKDFNITVINRNEISDITTLIESEILTDIHLPTENINKWQSQFKNEL